MGKFYEIIGMDNLNKDGLRDDILRYETIDNYGMKHDKFVIQLNIIQLWIMKIRLLKFNLKNDTRIGLIAA